MCRGHKGKELNDVQRNLQFADTDVAFHFLLLPDITNTGSKKSIFKEKIDFWLKIVFFEGTRSKTESFDVITDSKDVCF